MTGPAALSPRRLIRSQGLKAFRHRNYRLFFGGQAISLVGTWMQQVAQAWLVLQVSGGDPFWLGVVAAAQFLPVMIFGLFAGILADALPKRQTLIAVQIVMMTLAAILAVLTAAGVVEIWMIVVLAFALGCANAVDMPVRQSFAIEMVGRDEVGNAVALNSAMFNGARVVGPAVAGLTIGAFGIAVAFGLNALSFVAVIAGLAMMRDDELHVGRMIPRPSSVHDVRVNLAEGLRFVRDTPVVLMAVTVVGLVATFGMNFSVVVPPLAQDVLGSDAAGYGFLMTASGIGALTTAVWLVAGGRPRPWRIAAGAVVLGVASIALAISTSYPLSLLLMVPIGAGGITMAATANASIQLSVPDGLRGRVMSVYTTVFSASVPLGGLLMGALASAAGIAVAIAIGGVLSLATGLVGVIWWRRIRGHWTGLQPRAETVLEVDEAAVGATPAVPGTTTGVIPAPAVVAQSTPSGAPNTSAAFKPPKPNEVLSTRR